eukprot:9307327-Pyramimonas_sp.AAC.1
MGDAAPLRARPFAALDAPFKPKGSLALRADLKADLLEGLEFKKDLEKKATRPSVLRALSARKVAAPVTNPLKKVGANVPCKVVAALTPLDPISEFVQKCEGEAAWRKRTDAIKREREQNQQWASNWKLSGQVDGKPLAPQPRSRFPNIDGAAMHAHNQEDSRMRTRSSPTS